MDGIIIIACGNPIYGNMAFNLAMSLKCNGDCHITCFYSESSLSELSEAQLKYFDSTVEVPVKYYERNGNKIYQRIKCFANELTPYSRTIMLDADTVWNINKPLNIEFDTFQIGCLGKWEGGNETHKGYVYWGEPKVISDYWHTDLIYKTYSGIVCFDKKSEFIWKNIQKVYDDINAPCDNWGGDKPDEYAFNVGIALSGYLLPEYYWMPVFFGYMKGRYFTHGITKNFLGMSVAGAFPDPYLITTYEQSMRIYSIRTGVPYKKYIKKGNVLKERKML